MKARDGVDVAARYFVYKLYEATNGQPMQSQILLGMGESAATISQAVERGWVVFEDVRGKPLDRKAALTDEGRRLARKGRQKLSRPISTEIEAPIRGRVRAHSYKDLSGRRSFRL